VRVESWLHIRLRWLESAYHLSESVFRRLDPLFSRIGYERADRLIRPLEAMGKRLLFDCRMCGQCILHSTGMTCSMTCPKNTRNGPCGGVRANGHCEVESERLCTWVKAYDRSLGMPVHGSSKLSFVSTSTACAVS
jgi:hypothetical protein